MKKLIRISYLLRSKFVIVSFLHPNCSFEVFCYLHNFLMTKKALLDPAHPLRTTLNFLLIFLYSFLDKSPINQPLKVNSNCFSAFCTQDKSELKNWLASSSGEQAELTPSTLWFIQFITWAKMSPSSMRTNEGHPHGHTEKFLNSPLPSVQGKE